MCLPRVAKGAAALALALVLGCSHGASGYDYSRETDPRLREYVVGPGDRLAIIVWRNADMSGEVQVRPDGMVTLPLVGDLPAAGKTPSAIRDDLVKRLTGLFKAEAVSATVSVREVASYRFVVTGNVEHPGVITSATFVSVLEAIALAGGPNRYANAERVVVIRVEGAGVRRIPVNYELLKRGEELGQNVMIVRGDLIHVP